jgi:prepilin-type processing-associated H-X9-DG protein
LADPNTTRDGATGWWSKWNATRQDYRAFAPVHRGACNILFADGSVRSYLDNNQDGLLNNGFQASTGNGFTSDKIELPDEEFINRWTLKAK